MIRQRCTNTETAAIKSGATTVPQSGLADTRNRLKQNRFNLGAPGALTGRVMNSGPLPSLRNDTPTQVTALTFLKPAFHISIAPNTGELEVKVEAAAPRGDVRAATLTHA